MLLLLLLLLLLMLFFAGQPIEVAHISLVAELAKASAVSIPAWAHFVSLFLGHGPIQLLGLFRLAEAAA